jgi:general secretion pathway protein E
MGGTETETLDKIAAGADQIIERAAKRGVSDIHIEPGPRFISVRYRHGGTLYVANKLPLAHAAKLTSHFKKQAKLDTGNVVESQIGNYELKIGRKIYNLQIATLPVVGGEKVTISLHELTANVPNLKELGLWGSALNGLNKSLAESRGLILVASRQANHLNSSLAALLQALANPSLKIAFINSQDLPLPQSIKQIASLSPAGLSIAAQLAVIEREHFDVLGIGWLAERQTAEKIQALARQKLVLAGILADTTASALQQFGRLHPEPALPPAALAQLFVRCLCEHCRESYKPADVELKQLALLFQTGHATTMEQLHELEKAAKVSGLAANEPLGSSKEAIKKLWRAKPHGCSHCDHTGYDGEIGVFELYQPNAARDNMVSLRVDGLIKALRGLIDFPILLDVYSIAN